MKKSPKSPDELKFDHQSSALTAELVTTVQEENFVVEEQETGISLEKIKLDIEILKGLRQNRRERRKYAAKVFYLIIFWLIADLMILTATGLRWLTVSDPVLITLITTTTGSVITIFIYVMKYLFNGSADVSSQPNSPSTSGS